MKECIKVNGMMCASCEKRIQNAIRSLEGVQDCTANADHNQVEIDFDEKEVALADIKETIEEVGYEVVG